MGGEKGECSHGYIEMEQKHSAEILVNAYLCCLNAEYKPCLIKWFPEGFMRS